MDRRRLLALAIGGALVIAAAGGLFVVAEQSMRPVFIGGGQRVTQDQVRQKQSEDYSNVRIVRPRRYVEAAGTKNGEIGTIAVDSQTGRLATDNDDDD